MRDCGTYSGDSSPKTTRTAYDKMSGFYDFLAGGSEKKMIKMGIDMLNPLSGERILEIGCGTGNGLIMMCASMGNDCEIHGLDLSDRMLARALQKIERQGLSSSVNLIHGNALRLPYHDRIFDGVFMSFTMELFDARDIRTLLSECRRVLKPTGRMCTVSMSLKAGSRMMTRLYQFFHKLIPRYVDCRPVDAERAMTDAGFHVQDSEVQSMWGLGVEIILARP